jgi:hypothetical protein
MVDSDAVRSVSPSVRQSVSYLHTVLVLEELPRPVIVDRLSGTGGVSEMAADHVLDRLAAAGLGRGALTVPYGEKVTDCMSETGWIADRREVLGGRYWGVSELMVH